jgi:exopolysaccharide production protein ExoZ
MTRDRHLRRGGQSPSALVEVAIPPSPPQACPAGQARTFLSIQALRALAASMVMLLHAAAFSTQQDVSGTAVRVLNAGVDIFFVISGFVMVVSNASRRNARDFLTARLIRIIPIYWLATAVMVLVLVLHDEAPTASEIGLSLLLVPYGDIRGDMHPVLGPGWTLSYEMFFYFLFAATLWLPPRRQVALLSICFLVLVALRPLGATAGAAGVRFTSLVLFEFVFGVLLGLIAHRLVRLPYSVGAAFVALGVIGFAATLLVPPMPRTLSYGIPAALLVAGVVGLERSFRHPALAPLTILGSASYALYLFHYPLAYLAVPILRDSFSFSIGFFILTVCSFAIGLAAHLWLERPLLATGRARRGCPASAPLRQISGVEERRISGSS